MLALHSYEVLQKVQPDNDRPDTLTPLRMVVVRLDLPQPLQTTIDVLHAGQPALGVARPLVDHAVVAHSTVPAGAEDVEVTEWGRRERIQPTAILHVLQVLQDPHGHRGAPEGLLSDEF